MPIEKQLRNFLLKERLPASWAMKLALAAVVVVTSLSALRVAYNRGYVISSSSPEYLASLGVFSHHGDFLAQLNILHLQITIGCLVCALGISFRRPLGLLLSLVGLAWAGTIYAVWYWSTLDFMVEQEIPKFDLLQGPGKQHLLALREGTWWDIGLLIFVIVVAWWLLKNLFRIFVQFRKYNAISTWYVQ